MQHTKTENRNLQGLVFYRLAALFFEEIFEYNISVGTSKPGIAAKTTVKRQT